MTNIEFVDKIWKLDKKIETAISQKIGEIGGVKLY